MGKPSSVWTTVVDKRDAEAGSRGKKPIDATESRPRREQSIGYKQPAWDIPQNSVRLIAVLRNIGSDCKGFKPVGDPIAHFGVNA
jgi:hypothetical protein